MDVLELEWDKGDCFRYEWFQIQEKGESNKDSSQFKGEINRFIRVDFGEFKRRNEGEVGEFESELIWGWWESIKIESWSGSSAGRECVRDRASSTSTSESVTGEGAETDAIRGEGDREWKSEWEFMGIIEYEFECELKENSVLFILLVDRTLIVNGDHS
jgi:hypothetical protein